MSSLATNAITDASGGNTATINSYTPTESNMAGRNKIINGDMRIDQRNAGASVTRNTLSNVYTLDRWNSRAEGADGVYTVQQITDAPSGFVNSLKVTTTTADAALGATQIYAIHQPIEGNNCSDFAWGTADAKPITISFWIKSSLTGTFGGSVENANGSRAYPFSYEISSANTWEYKTIAISGDTTGTWETGNAIGLWVWFGLGVGATGSGTSGAWGVGPKYSATGAVSVIGTLNATWQITGVQLEAGSVATPFEHRMYGQELALCQRYYQNLFPDIDMPVIRSQTSDTLRRATVFLKVSMRVSPTAVITDNSGVGTYSVVSTTVDAVRNSCIAASAGSVPRVTGLTADAEL